MKTIVVSIKDLAVQAFQQPFTVRAKGEALRGFQDAINNRETQFSKHAEDYELYELGNFDDETGKLEQHPEPVLITRGKDLVIDTGIRMTR